MCIEKTKTIICLPTMWEDSLSHLETGLFYICNIFDRKSLLLCIYDASWNDLITKGATDLIEFTGLELKFRC